MSITGFDIDNQRIARAQLEATKAHLEATHRLAKAIEDLTALLKNETIKRRAKKI